MKKALWIIFSILGLVGAGIGISFLVRKKGGCLGSCCGKTKYID